MDYTDIANKFEQDGNLDGLETLFNKNIVPINVLLLNGTYETRWTDVSNVFKEYYEDLNSEQQDYIQQLNPKKEYWKVIFEHDLKVYNKYDIDCDWTEKPNQSEYQKYYS